MRLADIFGFAICICTPGITSGRIIAKFRAKFKAITSQNGILRSSSFFRLREIEEKDADKKRIDEIDIHANNFSANRLHKHEIIFNIEIII